MRSFVCILFCSIFMLSCHSPLISQNDENTAAEYNTELGLAYLKEGQIDRAKHKLLLALQETPKDTAAVDAMAYFLEKTGETAEAQKYYLRAIALAPKNGAVQNNYGTYLCRQGQYSLSITHFLLATKDPNYLHPAEAYENAGLCALKIPAFHEAKQYFLKAIDHDPNRATSLLELANLSYNEHDYLAAKNYQQRYGKLTRPNIED